VYIYIEDVTCKRMV